MPTKADFDVEIIVKRQIALRLQHSVALFQDFSLGELVEFLSLADKCTAARGEYVLREGEDGSSMFVIVSGEVDIRKALPDGGEKSLIVLGPGDCFGEMALVDRLCRSASVLARVDCLFLRLREENLGGVPECRAKFYRNIARLLSVRLRDSNAMISLLLSERH